MTWSIPHPPPATLRWLIRHFPKNYSALIAIAIELLLPHARLHSHIRHFMAKSREILATLLRIPWCRVDQRYWDMQFFVPKESFFNRNCFILSIQSYRKFAFLSMNRPHAIEIVSLWMTLMLVCFVFKILDNYFSEISSINCNVAATKATTKLAELIHC